MRADLPSACLAWSKAAAVRNGLPTLSAPIVLDGPCPGKHDRVVRTSEQPVVDRVQFLGRRPARQVGAADGTGEQGVAGEQDLGALAVAGQPEHHRAAGVPGSVVDRQRQPGQVRESTGRTARARSGDAGRRSAFRPAPPAARGTTRPAGRPACTRHRDGCRPGRRAPGRIRRPRRCDRDDRGSAARPPGATGARPAAVPTGRGRPDPGRPPHTDRPARRPAHSSWPGTTQPETPRSAPVQPIRRRSRADVAQRVHTRS